VFSAADPRATIQPDILTDAANKAHTFRKFYQRLQFEYEVQVLDINHIYPQRPCIVCNMARTLEDRKNTLQPKATIDSIISYCTARLSIAN
jgi:hypothetical protein